MFCLLIPPCPHREATPRAPQEQPVSTRVVAEAPAAEGLEGKNKPRTTGTLEKPGGRNAGPQTKSRITGRWGPGGGVPGPDSARWPRAGKGHTLDLTVVAELWRPRAQNQAPVNQPRRPRRDMLPGPSYGHLCGGHRPQALKDPGSSPPGYRLLPCPASSLSRGEVGPRPAMDKGARPGNADGQPLGKARPLKTRGFPAQRAHGVHPCTGVLSLPLLPVALSLRADPAGHLGPEPLGPAGRGSLHRDQSPHLLLSC